MCNGKPCDKCKSRTASVVQINKGTVKDFDGRKVIVLPVVMAKADVVMNGGLLPEDEYQPLAWNGIPVTVGHPETKGKFASARDPAVHEEWVVGNLYNAHIEENSLRADLWIDIQKADAVHPGLVNELVKGTPMDVSTGYFCDAEPETGKVGGREYFEVQRNIIPDHLALLPNEVGACNWNDGCGVRPNKENFSMPNKVRQALKVISNALAPSRKDEEVTVDDIISNASSPYTEEDRESLSKMSTNTLRKIADQFVKNEDDDEEMENEDDKEEENEEEEPKRENAAVLSDEDKEALAFARRHSDTRRRELVSKITGNSRMTEKQLKTYSLTQLEQIAEGLPSGNYAGRASAVNHGEEDEHANDMLSTGVLNTLRKKKEKVS